MGLFFVATCITLAIVGTASVCSFFGQANTVFEMLSHFRVFFIIALGVLAAVFALLRSWKGAVIASVLFLLNASNLVPLYCPEKRIAADNQVHLKILQFNVWGGKNHDVDRTIRVIDQEKADLVGISEITTFWKVQLDKCMDEYPYRVCEPHLGGISLFSKYPLEHPEIKYFGLVKRPRITADIKVGGRTIRVFMVHPTIPRIESTNRDGELAVYATESRASQIPVILFGDLNTTPFSFYFNRLLEDGKLRDTERGFGYRPTWPGWPRWRPLFAIDHCLVSEEFTVVDRRVLGNIGSDHLPVVVELSVPAKSF